MEWSTAWQAVTALATVALAAIALGAGILALRQLRELASTRKLEAFLHATGQLRSAEQIRNRRRIYNELADWPPEHVPPDLWDAVEGVARVYDDIGAQVERGLIDRGMILERDFEVILRCWGLSKPYLEHRAKLRGRAFECYERLYQESVRYWKAHHPQVRIQVFAEENGALRDVPIYDL